MFGASTQLRSIKFRMDLAKNYSVHPLYFVILLFFLATIFVNPLRQTAWMDDWAYSLMVEHLLETGKYQLHDWTAANMPFQIYWGALFANVFGYSFSILRISTLVLSLAGCIAFYYLAKTQGYSNDYAAFLTLVLFSSVLVFRLSFSFMTDVPFYSLSIAAFLFYSIALRSQKYSWMIVGSIFAAAAILTRTFGVAFLPALFLLWVFNNQRRQTLTLFIVAALLPLAAAIWQLVYGYLNPNWTHSVRVYEQLAYWQHGWKLIPSMTWRFSTVLHYLAFFCVPFVLLGLWTLLAWSLRIVFWKERLTPTVIKISLVVFVFIVASLLYGVMAGTGWLMPYLPWNFESLKLGRRIQIPITLFTTAGAVIFGVIFVRRFIDSPGWNQLKPEERLIDLTALFLLVEHLIYFSWGDEYILVFLPFAILTLARFYANQWRKFAGLCILSSLLILSGTALWTRSTLEQKEAWWKGADLPIRNGATHTDVMGSFEWNGYYSFDDYLRELGDWNPRSLNDYFYRWYPQQTKNATFFVTVNPQKLSGKWEVLNELPFRDEFFRKRSVFLMKRVVPIETRDRSK